LNTQIKKSYEDAVLLAPVAPQILSTVHLLHREILAKAKQFHDDNMNENYIVAQLNAELQNRWKKTRDGVQQEENIHTSMLPQITLTDVRHAIKCAD